MPRECGRRNERLQLSTKRAVAAARNALAMCLAAWCWLAAAQTPDVERARKEAEVVWYTAMSTQDADAMRRAFADKYPGMNVTVLRQPGEKIRTRILAEAQANKH